MKTQNYANHRQHNIIYNYITFFIVVLLFVSSLYYTYRAYADGTSLRPPLFLLLISFVLLVYFFSAWSFAVKAQDRAIRAEENLRHFVITGKLLDERLNIHQITALRFASDEEFPVLAQKAVEDDMKSDDIKKAIKNWRPDFYRI